MWPRSATVLLRALSCLKDIQGMRPTEIAGIALAAVVGAGIGALAMFMLDPVSGPRRRALARDKAARYGREAVEAVETTARDLRNRAQGVVAEARGAVSNVMQWTGPERRLRPRDDVSRAPESGTL
jgi:hypothetical protein